MLVLAICFSTFILYCLLTVNANFSVAAKWFYKLSIHACITIVWGKADGKCVIHFFLDLLIVSPYLSYKHLKPLSNCTWKSVCVQFYLELYCRLWLWNNYSRTVVKDDIMWEVIQSRPLHKQEVTVNSYTLCICSTYMWILYIYHTQRTKVWIFG